MVITLSELSKAHGFWPFLKGPFCCQGFGVSLNSAGTCSTAGLVGEKSAPTPRLWPGAEAAHVSHQVPDDVIGNDATP